MDLTLNGSEDSKLGPGIWLDPATTTPFSRDFSQFDFDYNGLTYEQHFYLSIFDDLTTISSQTFYHIRLSSQPGTAVQDNANYSLSLARNLLGLPITLVSCRINTGIYDVEPIPGTYAWGRPSNDQCTQWLPTWLTNILN